LNNKLLRILLDDTDAWEMITFNDDEEAPISFMRSAQTPRTPE
jgi:UDP-3-O-[3-hydroxymyristoyl] N-acetylglucosamine deacetylase